VKQRRARVQTDPDQLVVVPAEGTSPLLFRRLEGRVALQGPWETPAEGQPLPAASLVVLGTGRTLSRVIELPEAENAKLEAALQLQVSTLQMGAIPTRRTAMALLPWKDGDEGRTGLVVEWPPSDAPVVADLSGLPPEGDPLFASDLACLAALLESGAEGPLVALHPDRTVMAFGVHVGARTLLRITRLDPSDWNASAEVAVVESAVRAGADGSTASRLLEALREAIAASEEGGFGCTEPDRERLAMELGVESDAAWWRAHGLALGAARAWFGPLRSLVSLREQPAGERAGPWGQALNRLSDRQMATRLVIAALVGLAVLPPAISGLRLLMLQWKVGDLASLERAIQAHRQRVSLYGELQRRAWPMGKLLGDLASVTPEGIEWENIQLSQDRNVSIAGSAKPHDGLDGSEVILRMERQMVESRVFDRVQKKWDPPDAKGSTGFTLSAVVARPTFRPSYAADQDFARRTLSDRRYGPQKPEEPTPEPEEPRASTAAPAAADLPPSGDLETPSSAVTLANSTPAAEPAAADTATEERSDASTTKGMRRAVPSGTSGGLARRSERTPGSSDATVPVPPPITDEQIAAMTRSEASEAASRVAKARREASVDAATQARLKSEFEKLMLRSRSNP
jgi:hypothetical protein